jgi:putative MATE family efflux protein
MASDRSNGNGHRPDHPGEGQDDAEVSDKDIQALLNATDNQRRSRWRPGARGPNQNGPGGAGRPGGQAGPNAQQRWQGRDLTTGSIPRNLWGMAWPQSVDGVLRVVDQLLDLIWAGFLGTVHIAGIGVAQQYNQMAWTARQGIDTANRAMVSRAIGMGNIPLAELTVYQAITVTTAFWILIAGTGIILTEPLLRILGVSEGVIGEAAPYMRIQFMAQGIMAFQQLFSQTLIASGDPLTPMRAHILSRVTHGILSPFLVFGFFFFPELGISGAALAAATGNSAALFLVARALLTGRTRLHLSLADYRVDKRLIVQLLRIGVPAAINGAERAISQLILVRFVTPFGDNALAAFTLSRRVEMFANLGSQGFGQASGVIVGQNLGAGNPTRAKQTIYWALGYVTTVKTILTISLFLFPEVFLSLFTRDQELLSLVSTWVRIQAFGYLAMGSGQVFMQSFMTAGATTYPMVVTLVALWGVELPLAYLLSHELGAGQLGIAWAVSAAMFVRPIFHIPYFLSGRWMRARVFSDATLMEMQQQRDRAPEQAPA